MRSVLEIRPLTRVEGHGTAQVHLDGGRVERVDLSLCESPRLFEVLLVGKRFDELPEIICRICSICSSVHRVTSLLAIEHAFGTEVSEQTRLHRELIVNGGQIESHALHLFCLALPDYLGASGFAELAVMAPEELKRGLRIKAAGNMIQETVGGRLIHPANLIPGGLGKPVGEENLLKLRDTLAGILPETVKTFALVATLPSLSTVPIPPPRFLALRPDAAPLFGDTLTTSDGLSFPASTYREMINETVPPHSNAKSSTVGGAPATVGAIARLTIGEGLSPEATRACNSIKDKITDADIRANSLAQSVELISMVERSLAIIDRLLEARFAREAPARMDVRRNSGTAATEAPRGVLIHSYAFDGRGVCTAADIVTPTAINQAAMERDLYAIAKALEGADDEEMKRALEIHVRAYDPCISCAVHLVRR